MREIEAFEAVDGTVFTDANDAQTHDLDCIGAEFDALLQIGMLGTSGNVTRNDQYQMCLSLLKRRDEAKLVIDLLHKYLSH